MISVKLTGGLGNVMFQIATIEWLGKSFDKQVCYTNVDTWIENLKTDYFWLKHAEDYLTIFPNIDLYKNHNQRFVVKRNCEVQFRYTDCLPEDGDFFIGYFQSERNFLDFGFIKNLFEPSEAIKTKMAIYHNLFNGITCSISVRRRNYLNLSEIHPPQGYNYYIEALSRLANIPIDKFLIFSDDINWCRFNFIGDKFVFIEDTDYIEMFLVAKCTHHIIANSSFSWWGAWLGEKQDSITITPLKWFGPMMPTDHSADIVPNRWIKI